MQWFHLSIQLTIKFISNYNYSGYEAVLKLESIIMLIEAGKPKTAIIEELSKFSRKVLVAFFYLINEYYLKAGSGS